MALNDLRISRSNYRTYVTFYDKTNYNQIKEFCEFYDEIEPKKKFRDVMRDYTEESRNRAKRAIIEYGTSNFWTHFITLTLDPKKINRYDIDLSLRKILKYFNNFKNRVDFSFKYLLVPEFHKNGAIHYHGLIYTENDCFLKKKKENIYVHEWFLEKLGANRFIEIRNNSEYCALYIAKYVTKDLSKISKFSYFCSKGLRKRTIVYSGREIDGLFEKLNNLSQYGIGNYHNNYVISWNFKNEDFERIFDISYKNACEFYGSELVTIE